ncbi:MAG: hypothetical protein COA82_10845 [Alkaliphilus sp.]|nr:hypothetical protein [Alkaliphilus sp. AH-315-G20]MBN4074841.1 hypothetical protein [bacterium AH-315-E09]PHS30940.1 MAG: hypothetical protein COA82_10845 [Alkaliphilus sp.]
MVEAIISENTFKVSNLKDRSIELDSCVCIDEAKVNDYLQYELKEGDAIITTVGSWPTNPNSVVGKVVKVSAGAEGTLLNQNSL